MSSEKELGAEFWEKTWFNYYLNVCRNTIFVRRTKGVKKGWLKAPSVK
jgi:hypothetical protein